MINWLKQLFCKHTFVLGCDGEWVGFLGRINCLTKETEYFYHCKKCGKGVALKQNLSKKYIMDRLKKEGVWDKIDGKKINRGGKK